MTLSREQALQYVTDRLCGEIDERRLHDLQNCLNRNPDLAEEVRMLEAAWEALEVLEKDMVVPPMPLPMGENTSGGGDPDELFEEELDWVAGGIGQLFRGKNESEND